MRAWCGNACTYGHMGREVIYLQFKSADAVDVYRYGLR